MSALMSVNIPSLTSYPSLFVGGGREEAIRISSLGTELLKWTPDMRGVWIEIGLVGMDFEVLGDPVQELWLPREIPTDTIYFAVRPLKAGACRLRFCLYYQQNIFQSFRLAALTLEPNQKDVPARKRRQMLAAALAVAQKVVGDAGYLTRLEYSSLSSVEGVEMRPPRKFEHSRQRSRRQTCRERQRSGRVRRSRTRRPGRR
jgi:hypothetical protein